MLRAQLQRAVDVLFPPCGVFARKPEHQVHADVADAGVPQSLHRHCRLVGRVPPADEAENVGGKTLRPHAHPVDWRRSHVSREILRHVVGVALESHLQAPRLHLIIFIYGVENPVGLPGRQSRGSSAAEINRPQRFGGVVFSQFQFAAHRVGVPRAQFRGGGGIEAAVDAAAFAERDVNVKSGHENGMVYSAKILICFKILGFCAKFFCQLVEKA